MRGFSPGAYLSRMSLMIVMMAIIAVVMVVVMLLPRSQGAHLCIKLHSALLFKMKCEVDTVASAKRLGEPDQHDMKPVRFQCNALTRSDRNRLHLDHACNIIFHQMIMQFRALCGRGFNRDEAIRLLAAIFNSQIGCGVRNLTD